MSRLVAQRLAFRVGGGRLVRFGGRFEHRDADDLRINPINLGNADANGVADVADGASYAINSLSIVGTLDGQLFNIDFKR